MLVLWLSTSSLLDQTSWALNASLGSFISALFLVLVFFGMTMILVESTLTFVVAWALAVFAGMLWFQSLVFLAGAVGAFVMGVVGYFRGRYELQNIIKGGLVRPLRKTVPLMATFLFIALATGAYVRAPIKTINAQQIFSETRFLQFLSYAEPFVKRIIPDFSQDITFADYIVEAAARQNHIDSSIIGPADRARIIDAAAKQFEKDYGLRINPDETMGHLTYIGAMTTLTKQVVAYQTFLPIAFSIGLFAVLRLIALPVYWFGFLITSIIIKALTRAGVVELRAVPVELVAHSFS